MSDKDIAKLVEIAENAIERVKTMTKKEAINSLNEAGIVTKKASSKKPISSLRALFRVKPSFYARCMAQHNHRLLVLASDSNCPNPK